MRIEQPIATRGSQKWLQILINNYPELITSAFRDTAELASSVCVEWLSPLTADNNAEYQDKAFVERLGINLLHRPLETFWPSRGPVWDGLGRSSENHLLLLEAKSHIAEIASPATGAVAETFIQRIQTKRPTAECS